MYYTNILEYLEATEKRVPEKIAFSDGVDSKSFGTLLYESKSVGSFLLENGYYAEPIIILMNKHPNAMSSFFGTIYAGCFYVAIDGISASIAT